MKQLISSLIKCSLIKHLNRSQFNELLDLSLLNYYFIFYGEFYLRYDGVSIGISLEPMFANELMAYYVEIWLKECLKEFKQKIRI